LDKNGVTEEAFGKNQLYDRGHIYYHPYYGGTFQDQQQTQLLGKWKELGKKCDWTEVLNPNCGNELSQDFLQFQK